MENTWNFSPAGGGRHRYNVSAFRDAGKMKAAALRRGVEKYEEYKACLDAQYIEELLKLRGVGGVSLRFHRIGMSDIPELRGFFVRYGGRTCDYSLGGVMMWIDYFRYEMAVAGNTLFLKGYDRETDTTVFYAPIGEMPAEAAKAAVREYCAQEGCRAVMVEDVETSFEEYEQTCAADADFRDPWKEYLYEIEKFINFPGKKMEKKRNHLHNFLKHYEDVEIEEIADGNCAELIEFTRNFEENHEDTPLFEYEAEETIKVLENYGAYNFTGILLRHEGKVIGYTFGEKTGDTFHVHVEKGNVFYQGIYQMLASTLAERVAEKWGDVRYLNREEDMGNESLRKSKESYHPALIVNKRIVRY